MINLSKFAETLCDLMFEHDNMTAKALAEELGIPAPTITRYRKAQHVPTVDNLVKIADYFHRSTDFLLGLEEENLSLTFKPCPPFSEQLIFLTKYFKDNYCNFYHTLEIPESTFFEWKNGSSKPSLESIEKIADYFGRRIDFILGRET